MARHYGIPYMGSKQKLVDKIVPFILNRHPGVDSFYDLFGGGGSVSLYVVRKYPHLDVVYNERSKAISALMQHLKDGGDIPMDFVTREQFEAGYKGDDLEAGILQTCWSFGNSQKSYLYSSDIEPLKHALHDLVVSGAGDLERIESLMKNYSLATYDKEINPKIFLDPARYSTSYQRRIVIQRQVTGHPGVLQHFQYLERLVQIENMPGIATLGISSGRSYDEVPIIGERPIIYCDPPYEGTAEYREGDFNHKQFYDWCMAQTVPVYVSSYQVSDPRFKRVKAINTRSLLNSSKSKESSYNYENIYWNGVE